MCRIGLKQKIDWWGGFMAFFCCRFDKLQTDLNKMLFFIFRFVPYIGIVTILMNDYPKFKVSLSTLLNQCRLITCALKIQFNSLIRWLSCVSVLQYAVLFMLGLFVLVHREWDAQSSGLEKTKLRPGNLSHAFQNRIKFDFVKPNRLFCTICLNIL